MKVTYVKKLVITVIAISCILIGSKMNLLAQIATDPEITAKMKHFELYDGDAAHYPYEVLGEIVYEGLQSEESRRVLKERAIRMGADAVIYYENHRGPYGFKAKGIAVRFKGPGKDS